MNQWEPGHITAVASAVCAVIAAMFSERVVRAFRHWSEWRAERADKRMAAAALDRELDEKGHKMVIRRMDRQITQLEARCHELHEEHTQCRESLGTLRGEYSMLRERYDSVVMRLEQLEKK